MRKTIVAILFVVASGVLPRGLAAQGDDRSAKVDALFARYTSGTPGCAVGVAHNGKLVHRKGYGSANLDHGIPLSTNSVFYIASVSKQFTAAVTIFLADDGLISLDDDIRKYIPELPDYGTTITIRQLVHHTSGLRDYLRLMNLAGMRTADVHSEDEILRLIANQRELNFTPGTEYLYSNSGYLLISVLTRRVTGKSLREYAEEKIFGPLGMKNTHFHDDRTMIVPGRATSYSARRDGSYAIADWFNFEQVGSGGLHSTVEDLFLWDQNFYQNRLSAKDLIPMLHSRGVLANGDTLDYAFGLRISEYRGLRTVSHGGSSMGFRTHLLRFPDEHFSAIVLCNVGNANPGRLAEQIADIYLADRLGPPTRVAASGSRRTAAQPVKLTAAQLGEFTGQYHSPELNVDYTFSLEGDALVLTRPAAQPAKLTPVGKDTFRAGTLTFSFTRDGNGGVNGFLIDAGRIRNLRFDRR